MSRPRMRRGDRNAVRLACAIVFILPVAALLSTQAKADPVDSYTAWKATNICNYFTQTPHVASVGPMFTAVQEDTGFSGSDTARVLVEAVSGTCPEFMPLLRVFSGLPAQGQQVTTGAIGGTYKASAVGGVLR